MKLAYTYEDHHSAGTEWDRRNLKEWLKDIFNVPAIVIAKGCTNLIRENVEKEFRNDGWALNVRLDNESKIKVFSIKADMAFQLQTGNMSRAPYDLLKLEFLYKSERIEAAALGLPTQKAAKKMGDNIAHSERVIRELKLFCNVITVPLLVIAFE